MTVGDIEEVDESAHTRATRQIERLFRPHVDHPDVVFAPGAGSLGTNPNSFGMTLGTLRGTLHLEGSRAATVDFPFGLPLQPQSEEIVPIDISVDFRDVPGLGQAITRAVARQPIAFEIEGTIGVEAGRLGTQTLGPMTWLRGELR